jgi:predicted nuclease of predicted toxin-antitoxin system
MKTYPIRLVFRLADLYPESRHVNEIGLQSGADTDVWEYAGTNGYTIVSKDSDFHDRSLILGHPPRVIWLRLGNCSTDEVEQVLRNSHAIIFELHQEETASFVVIS